MNKTLIATAVGGLLLGAAATSALKYSSIQVATQAKQYIVALASTTKMSQRDIASLAILDYGTDMHILQWDKSLIPDPTVSLMVIAEATSTTEINTANRVYTIDKVLATSTPNDGFFGRIELKDNQEVQISCPIDSDISKYCVWGFIKLINQ